MSGTEGLSPGAGGANPTMTATNFNVTMPETILLEAQSGIAADTLLFGSVRYTAWDGFSITPNRYPDGAGGVGGSLVSYTDDVMTYTLGLGCAPFADFRDNDAIAFGIRIGYQF